MLPRHKWLRPAGLNNSGLEPVLLSNVVFSREASRTKMLGLLFENVITDHRTLMDRENLTKLRVETG